MISEDFDIGQQVWVLQGPEQRGNVPVLMRGIIVPVPDTHPYYVHVRLAGYDYPQSHSRVWRTRKDALEWILRNIENSLEANYTEISRLENEKVIFSEMNNQPFEEEVEEEEEPE